MAKIILHRRVRIVTLEGGESMNEHCRKNDIALMEGESGWHVYFFGEDGEVTGYEEPFSDYRQALHTAKAAAEFASE